MRGLLGCEGSKASVGIQLFVLLEVVQHVKQQGSDKMADKQQGRHLVRCQ